MHRAIIAFFILILIAGCSKPVENVPVVPQAPVAQPEPTPIVEPAAEAVAVADPCSVSASDYQVWGEKDGYKVGLKSIRLDNKDTWYKAESAEVYAMSNTWLENDITIQLSQQGSGLMDFNRKLVPLDPNTDGRCFIGTIPLDISIKNLSMDYATITFGRGRDRNGKPLLTAEGQISFG